MTEGTDDGEIATSEHARASRVGGLLEIRPLRALGRIEDATPAELADIWRLVGEVQKVHAPAGARVEFDTGAREPLVIRVRVREPPNAPALRGFVPGEEVHLVEVLRAGLERAAQVDMLAAFVMLSGIREIAEDLADALRHGAHVRLLTGDYLGTTEPEALAELLAMMSEYSGLKVKLYRCPPGQSFHAKAYVFVAGSGAAAYVGSSNLSRTALTDGIEWSLRAVDSQAEFAEIRARFSRLWESEPAERLTIEVLEDYRRRRPTDRPRVDAADLPPPPPTPHVIQREALDALREARAPGQRRGLIVLATGLGKTLLSAFDFEATGWRRALFVAHREEILGQARKAWSSVLPARAIGRWSAGRREGGAEVVFASIQALTRADALEQLDPGDFDYVVIDEFHHAAAAMYRRLIDRLRPRYLLGLTATPERGDGADLLALCDGNVVYRAGLHRGLEAGLLVPFHYYGLMSRADYNGAWRSSGRFDVDALTHAVATREHAAQALAALDARAPRSGRRALVFCCSVAHADFMAEFMREQGIAAAAVHSGPTSAPRAESLRRFTRGELTALTTVDLFNEGLDVPDIDAVLMLRPTESPVIFLQQIGRGLRVSRAREKPCLTVVDVVGNHATFASKLDALGVLIGGERGRLDLLKELRRGRLDLPPGCEVALETEALDVLEQLCTREREAESRPAVLELGPPSLLKVTHNAADPILVLDRKHRPDTPEGEVAVDVDGEAHVLRFVRHFVNVANKPGAGDNVLPDILRRWFSDGAGWGRDAVVLARRGGRLRLEPARGGMPPVRRGAPFYADLAVACGVGPLSHGEPEARTIAVRSSAAIDRRAHFVVRAEGDSMDGGDAPIRDGDLVLCAWARGAALDEVAGRPCVLAIDAGPESTEVVLKVPVRVAGRWVLRSRARNTPDRTIEEGAAIRVIARVIEVVYLV